MATEFKNFTASERAILMNAITEAKALSDRAWKNNFISKKWQSDLPGAYEKWFGAITAQRFDKVRRNIGVINYALNSQKITWIRVSDDPQNYAAALIPKDGWGEQKVKQIIDSGYIVKIGDLFFSSQDDRERHNTIIHEISHIVVDTEDEVNPDNGIKAYGENQCTNLKNNYPDLAINNAENYGYFHLEF